MAEKTPEDRAGNVIDMLELRGGENRGAYRVQSSLLPGGNKAPYATTSNALIILANDPPVAGMLGFNEFIMQPVIVRPPPVAQEGDTPLPGPYPRPWTDTDQALVLAYIQRVWNTKMTTTALREAMMAEASQRRFHPVRDWLKSLVWDGKPRLNGWLRSVFRVPDDEYHEAVGAKLLIAAVRRVMKPGCKFDQMMVLEGKQNIGKSTVVKVLFGEEWFSDCLHSDLTHRDAPMSLTGKWGVELAEIQHFLRNGDEAIKAFLSRPVDTYRDFGRKQFLDVPRQSVLIGTTNTTDYLRDVTGNRRIWPVKCPDCRIEWLHENRDQLWAEAVVREASGEAIWLDDPDVKVIAEHRQIERMAEDSWTDAVLAFLLRRNEHTNLAPTETRVSTLLHECLAVPRAQQTRSTEMRVAAILRGIGWESKQSRKGSAVVRVWRPTEAWPPLDDRQDAQPEDDPNVPF